MNTSWPYPQNLGKIVQDKVEYKWLRLKQISQLYLEMVWHWKLLIHKRKQSQSWIPLINRDTPNLNNADSNSVIVRIQIITRLTQISKVWMLVKLMKESKKLKSELMCPEI